MLYLYPAYVAWHYYLLMAAAALVTFQAAAATAGLRGLQIGGRLWPRDLAWGTLVVTLAVGVVGFVDTSPDFLSPGLAGSELMVCFGGGVATAGVISLLGGLLCRPPRSGPFQPLGEHPLPVADYAYRRLRPPAVTGPLVIVLPDPDLPPRSVMPVLSAALDCGSPCAVVSWGREGVPRYPDAMAVVPMLITAETESEGLGPVVVVGLGACGDLALRSAADDERIGLALAVGPALVPENVLSGLLLLREMNAVDAWRWQRRWPRQRFVAAVQGAEALARLGERAGVLASRNDGFYHWDDELACGQSVRVLDEATHEDLIRQAAPGWVSEMLQTHAPALEQAGGQTNADPA